MGTGGGVPEGTGAKVTVQGRVGHSTESIDGFSNMLLDFFSGLLLSKRMAENTHEVPENVFATTGLKLLQ